MVRIRARYIEAFLQLIVGAGSRAAIGGERTLLSRIIYSHPMVFVHSSIVTAHHT